MLPRKIFETLHTVMGIFARFEQFVSQILLLKLAEKILLIKNIVETSWGGGGPPLFFWISRIRHCSSVSLGID